MRSFQAEALSSSFEPIAIVGVGCRLPGGITSLKALHDALRNGRDLITDIPPDRWNVDSFYDPDALTDGKTYVRRGSFVSEVDRFDAGFFGISDAEAARMDPQQRIVLQTVWHALEDAGQSAEELAHSNAGVFLAMMNTNNYAQLKGAFGGLRSLVAYDAMGDAMSIASGRIAHFLDVEGPVLTLDTACSSSVVALHLARQSLLAGDCDTAIVAGVNVILTPNVHMAFSKLGLMSRAGRCAAFDADADGYIRGEGCMAVVLRRLSQAVERGDEILACIASTAVNQDGHTPAVTAPNGHAQEEVMRSAVADLGISPSEIGYVEAHGTGTPVGDPIEMGAIARVFGPGRPPGEKLYVGSVKSNFGHIEAGAGLLGLVKTALSLKHEEIYPSLHFVRWNPNIELGGLPIEVPTSVVPWPRGGRPRMAGINSFGYSGTNAHAVLREAPSAANPLTASSHSPGQRARPSELVVISAQSKNSLDELADAWVDSLEKDGSASLSAIACAAGTARTHLKHRVAAVGTSKLDVAGKLRAWREGRPAKGLASGQTRFRARPAIAFMFTGQGAQYAGMGQELYRTEPHFAERIDLVAATMDAELGVPLKEVLFGAEAKSYLANTRYVQPALFAIEYALAELLRQWGVQPDFVIGHSVGEITAACVAGVLNLDDAIRFVVARGRLMGALPAGGKMLALATDVDQARQWIDGREADMSIAAVNGPNAVVVSGRAASVDAVADLAAGTGSRATPLEVSHAFHSPLMDPILAELSAVAQSMRIGPARIPIASNVTGDFHAERIEPGYWSDHVRQAVLFHAGLEKVVDAGATLLVEIGPHPALTPAVATSLAAARVQPVPTLKRDGKDSANLLGAMAMLYVGGAALNLGRLFSRSSSERVSLPLYPFRKDRHWLLPTTGIERFPGSWAETLPDLPPLHPLLGRVHVRNARRTAFHLSLTTTSPWTDHRVLGATVFPGTAYLDMAARAFAAMSGKEWCAVRLSEVMFERPLLLAYRKPKDVSLVLESGSGGAGQVRFVVAAAEDEREIYCQGRIGGAGEAANGNIPLSSVREGRTAMPIGAFYGDLRQVGLEYGARFSNVREVWLGGTGSGDALGRVAVAEVGAREARDPFANAILLDGCLHVFGAAVRLLRTTNREGAFVPASIRSATLRRELPSQVWSQTTVAMTADDRAAVATIRIANDEGEVLAELQDLELRHTTGLSASRAGSKAMVLPKAAAESLAARSGVGLVERLQPLNRPQRIIEMTNWLTAEIRDTMGQAAEGLDLDSLSPSTAFLEIGLDSLLVTELQRRIQEKLNFRFKPTQGLDYQTIESMAEFLLDVALVADLNREPARTA